MKKNNSIKICFLAPSGYGKSTAVQILSESVKLCNIKIAQPLYELQDMFYRYIGRDIGEKQDGEILQFFGMKVRKENQYFLLDMFKKRLRETEDEYKFITNDDCRPQDYKFLKDLGFLFVRIDGYRHDRDDHRKSDSANPLEWQDDIPCDFTVKNTGSLEEYKKNLLNMLGLMQERVNKCYIIPSFACNCNCSICISKSRDFKRMPLNLCETDMEYSLGLLKRRGIKKFELTGGGDPLLNPFLNDIVSKIRAYIPDAFIKVYTNGQVLKPITGVNEIDVSIMSADDSVNDMLMGCTHTKSLAERLKFWRETADSSIPGQKGKLRLSVAVMKGGIDRENKLLALVEGTKEYVDEYVVRTLYKGTPGYEDKYIDFHCDHPLIKWERDNDACSYSLVLSTDGNLYSGFSLTDRAYLTPYILLKPDSAPHFNKIMCDIKDAGFDIKEAYLMDDFAEKASKLYYLKHPEYFCLVKRHLELTQSLFGDKGVVLILEKEGSIEDVLLNVVQLKTAIRSNYGLTHKYKGTVAIDGGNFQLNVAHCPDARMEYYDKDMDILASLELIQLTKENMNTISRYSTYNILW